MPFIEDELDWQICYKKTDEGKDTFEAVEFVWMNEAREPLTFRNAYPKLKKIFEKQDGDAEKRIDKPLSASLKDYKGGRKRLFSAPEEAKILKQIEAGLSKRNIAQIWGCSEKTIRNIAKRYEKR